MFFPLVSSVTPKLAVPEWKERHLWLWRIFSFLSSRYPHLCSLTHDSCVIYPWEYNRAALNQPFVSLDTLSIIFPGRADSEHQFKVSSRPAPSAAVALGNGPLSPPPPQLGEWGELICSTPIPAKVSWASGYPERCSDHDPYPLPNTQAVLCLHGHTHARINFILCSALQDWRCASTPFTKYFYNKFYPSLYSLSLSIRL